MSPLLILLVIISIIFSVFLFYPVISGLRAKGKKIPDLSAVISEGLQKKPRYLLYIWAPSCGMCRGMTKVIDQLMEQRDDIGKIDASEHPEITRSLGVMGTPAIVLIKKGTIQKVSLGAKNEKVILSLLGV